MKEGRINLYSDTQTRPSPAMRSAIADAPVGDEQSFLDPTVNALCKRVADLLGRGSHFFALGDPVQRNCDLRALQTRR